jgi:ribosomal protein S18 acetylase RimI-like enzyme
VVEGRGLAVDPGMQGRGIGRALLDAAVEEARQRGARRLTLRVLSTNTAARAAYEAAGFEVEGVLRGEFVIDGREVDDVLMARELGSTRS